MISIPLAGVIAFAQTSGERHGVIRITPQRRVAHARPAIIIYEMPARTNHLARIDSGEFDVAMWSDGRIVWRNEWPPIGAIRDRSQTTYYESRISGRRIASLILKVHKSKAFELEAWGNAMPDACYKEIVLRYGPEAACLTCSRNPSTVAPYGTEPKEWALGLQTWRLVLKEARSMIPSSGGRVLARRPDDSDWKWNYQIDGKRGRPGHEGR